MDRAVFGLFGKILGYPGPDLSQCVAEAADAVGSRDPEAAKALTAFGTFVGSCEPGRIEEVYSETFDLNPAQYPYAGYHLCGESYKRSVLMVALSELYAEQGFDCGVELPDHLAVLLQFASHTDNERLAEDLLEEAVLPTVERLASGKGEPLVHAHECGPPSMKQEPQEEELQEEQPSADDRVRRPRPYDPVFVALLSVLKARVEAAA